MSLIKTFTKFSIGTWLSALISLLSTPVIAWLVNPEEFGKASMFTLAYNLLINIIMLGADQSFSRFYLDTDRSNRHLLLKEVLVPGLLFYIVVIPLLILFKEDISIILFDDANTSNVIYLLCFMLLIGLLLRYALLSIRMKSEAVIYSRIQIILAVSSFLIVIVYAWVVSNSFEAIVYGSVFSQLIALLLAFLYDREIWMRLTRHVGQVNWANVRKYLWYGLPFIPTFMLDWLFQSIDKAFLRYYSDYSQLGLYSLALKISLSLGIIQAGFTIFWLPFSLENYKNRPDDTSVYPVIFNSLTFAFGVLITLIVLCQQIILYILPVSYSGILPVFPFLLFIPMLYTLSEVTVVGVNFKFKPVYHLFIIVIAVIFNVLAAYFLIPTLGAKGASIAFFVGYLSFFAVRTYYGRKHYYFPLDIAKFIFTIVFLLIPVVCTSFIEGSLFYLLGIITLLVLWLFYKEDIKKVRNVKVDEEKEYN